MNLPNYFLADLPPEATLTAAIIRDACQTLRRNRAQYLAHAPSVGLSQSSSTKRMSCFNGSIPIASRLPR